jgi:hypothetical protein
MRLIEKEAGPDLPDFPAMTDLADVLDRAEPGDVEVMASELLAHLLRHDPPAVLGRFGMFIFDEAQILKESRYVLESTIALLDYLTRQTDHQIVLISAATGNAGAIAQWLSLDGQALRRESQWRAPCGYTSRLPPRRTGRTPASRPIPEAGSGHTGSSLPSAARSASG